MASLPSASSFSEDGDGDSIIHDEAVVGSPVGYKPAGPICQFGNRLAYTYFARPAPPAEVLNNGNEDEFWFTVDDQLLYLSFFQDSGPLNAGCLYRFCLHVHQLLEEQAHAGKKIILYSSDEPDKKANAAVLMVLYALVVWKWPTPDVLHPVACLELQPFRDAGYALPTYHLSLQSMVFGIQRALALQLLDFSTFDLVAYETYEKVENGDWNWLTPGFVAFASPVEPGYVARLAAGGKDGAGGYDGSKRLSRSFRNVLDEFQKEGVKVVVRLNKKLYDRTHFTERGIDHVEMYFDDGTNPSMEMCREFIDLSDRTISAGGAVAVHCKAGLGRTGTLIGAYLIYKHGFTADEAIAFMRLMRPGSCVGPQQHFLYENQMVWVRWAAEDKLRAELREELRAKGVAEAGRRRDEVRPLATTPPRQRAVTPETGGVGGVPRTPGRTVAVPGQPRKTPGKSNHGVAQPEVQHAAEMRERELAVEREALMLVVGEEGDVKEEEAEEVKEARATTPTPPTLVLPTPSPDKATGLASLHNGRPPSRSTTSRVRSTSHNPGLAPPASISSASATTNGAQPSSTRIARARPPTTRPHSALNENRIVDRVGRAGASSTTAGAAGADFRRSKAVKDLGTLFDAPAAPRYALRGGGPGSRGGTPPREGREQARPSMQNPPASPSRLPLPQRGPTPAAAQRVPAKRSKTPVPVPIAGRGRGAAAGGGRVAEVKTEDSHLRRTRRRRSSLDETDFAASR